MEGNATTALNNCSDKIVNSHPVEMFEDTSGYIIIIYIYAVLVVAATLFLYARYVLTPADKITVPPQHITLTGVPIFCLADFRAVFFFFLVMKTQM